MRTLSHTQKIKRMKTVFTNSEIVHVFNQQNQYEGRTSNGSMYFYNNKIYSYGSHYLLGEFLDNNTILINDKGYSNTTSKHIYLLIDATRDKKQYYTTKTDYKIVNQSIKEYLNKLVKARKTKDFYLLQIDSTLKMYFQYLEYTKQKTKFKSYKKHRETLRIANKFYNDFDNLKESIKQANLKESIKAKKEIVQRLKDWKNNKINWFTNKTNFDYLRINGENIETSQNVKIPISEAKRVLKLIEAKNVIGQRIDNRFTVTAFNNFLKVGCHNISIKEINYIKNLI